MNEQELLLISAKMKALENQAKTYKRTAELYVVCDDCIFASDCPYNNNLCNCMYKGSRIERVKGLNFFYEIAQKQIEEEANKSDM